MLEWSRARLLAHPGASLDPARARRFEALVERRRDGEPIAYITGRREFWSLDLAVTPDTLIPRPETEHLVEAVLGVVAEDGAATIADVGTGAGTVALALALERPRVVRPRFRPLGGRGRGRTGECGPAWRRQRPRSSWRTPAPRWRRAAGPSSCRIPPMSPSTIRIS